MQPSIPEEKLPKPENRSELYLSDSTKPIHDKVENAAEYLLEGEGTAVITEEEELTYSELRGNVNRAANFLSTFDLEEGDRVIIQHANTTEFFYSLFALIKMNMVPIPATPMNTAEDLEYLADDADAELALVSKKHSDKYDDLDIEAVTELPIEEYDDSYEADSQGEDFALLLYSSGTTGDPKGVIKTHRELASVGEVCAGCFELESEDIIGGAVPVSFAWGFLALALTPFTRDATVSLVDSRDPEVYADRINRDDITIFTAVPTFYNQLLDKTEDVEFPSLRLTVGGGEELKKHTYDNWKARTGLELVNYYGCTELLSIALAQQPGDLEPTYNGNVPDGMDARLFDRDENDRGELGMRGPVEVRYWNHEADTFRDGYFMMGDIFEKDKGEYRFVARKDNLIVTSGYKIHANEVEDALRKHPAVDDTAVVGVPDDTRGQLVKAYVVPEEDTHDGLVNELQGFVKATISPYKYPREIEFIDELPRTDVGKVDRKELEERG